MNQHLIRRVGGAAGSLAGFWLARNLERPVWYPHIIIGGLLGSSLTEIILQAQNKSHENRHDPWAIAAAEAGKDFNLGWPVGGNP